MNELRRLLEDAPDHVTEKLLSSAQDDDPSERALERTAAALGVMGATQLVSAPAAAKSAAVALKASATSKLSGVLLLKWLGLGVAAGLLVAGGAAILRRVREPPSHQESAVAVTVLRPAPPPARPAPVISPAVAVAEPAPSTTDEHASAAPASAAVAPGQRTRTIAAEIAALDRARSAMRRQDPEAALRALDELERSGAAALGPEAAVVRAEALLARGDGDAAAALARAFIAENPTSPHVERMREIAASAR
jgi:hypothetical protein